MCNENDRRVQSLQASLVLLMVTALSGLAHAESYVDPDYIPRTVQQMLEIDSRLALQKEQQREREAMGIKGSLAAPGPVLPVPSAALAAPLPDMQPLANPSKAVTNNAEEPKPPKPIALTLNGIFGLGDRLSADVLIDGRPVRFQRGHRYPLGYERGFAYGLIAINVPCVRLAGPQGPQTLCIERAED